MLYKILRDILLIGLVGFTFYTGIGILFFSVTMSLTISIISVVLTYIIENPRNALEASLQNHYGLDSIINILASKRLWFSIVYITVLILTYVLILDITNKEDIYKGIDCLVLLFALYANAYNHSFSKVKDGEHPLNDCGGCNE